MMCSNCMERIIITTEWFEVICHSGIHKSRTQPIKICSHECLMEWCA